MKSAISDTEATELMRKAYRIMRDIHRDDRTAQEQLDDAQRAGLYLRMVDLHHRITKGED